MPKNKIGGSGAKKAKNMPSSSRELTFKEESEDYAIVSSVLGGGKMKVMCIGCDNRKSIERIATIRGNMRKKVWINKDDLVLVSLRDFQDDRCDIILKYTPEEIKMLKSYDEIPKYLSIKNDNHDTDDTDEIQFDAQDSYAEIEIDDI
jgi:translation initiation factor 1A